MMKRSFKLTTSITKTCLFRCSLGGLMENFFGGDMSYNQVSCLLLRSCLINYQMGPSSLFMNTTDYSSSLIRLTIVSFEISTCRSIYWREISDDDTLLNGLKYSRLPVTRTFSQGESKKARISGNSSYRKIEANTEFIRISDQSRISAHLE